MLDQLLDNAIKFTESGYVSVQAQIEAHHLRIDVQDTGPGIARDKLPKVFDRFEQADVHTNRAYGGTGIGLAISKRLAELHQGQLQVQSELGKGTHFWITMPIELAQAHEGAATHTDAPTQSHADPEAELKVLLVDDNEVNLKLTDRSIRQHWPRAQLALTRSGEQALAWLEVNDVDVVVLDRIMPGMDGLELARRIRTHARPQVAHVALLGLTAYDDTTQAQESQEAGMDDVASKPIAPDALASKIKKVIHQRKALMNGGQA